MCSEFPLQNIKGLQNIKRNLLIIGELREVLPVLGGGSVLQQSGLRRVSMRTT